eukprot:1769247-Prymnesium_polylepis.1
MMWRNLVGLVFLRGGGDEDPQHSYGTELDRTRLRQVRDHWRGLGAEVPIFELTMERWGRLDHWDADGQVNLSEWPFELKHMDAAESGADPRDDDN